MTLFYQLNNDDISTKIRTAKQRVLYAAPGLGSSIAAALISASQKLGGNQVSVVVDPDPMICRLGYGTIDDLQMLYEQKVRIFKENNLRLSFLIADNEGYVFTKPALLIESFDEGDRVPNAMILNDQQIQSVMQATCPTLLEPGKTPADNESDLEIGESSITEAEIDKAKTNIDANPPQKYEISRKVRVFQTELLFVELRFLGSNIAQQTVSLPMGIRRLIDQDDETRESLQSRYKVMAGYENQELDKLKARAAALRKRYLYPIKDYGNIIRRRDKTKFEAEVERLKESLDELSRETIHFDPERLAPIGNIVASLTPLVKQAPPANLGTSPTNRQIEEWITDECWRQLKRKRSTLKIVSIFKDVTYETLKFKDFRSQARRAFPDLTEIFDEFDAVRASEGPVLSELTKGKYS